MYKLSILMIVLFLLSCGSHDQDIIDSKDAIQSEYLINVTELSANINSNKYKIIQVSPESIYAIEHIPGALQIWRPDYATHISNDISGLMATKSEMETLLQDLGINSEDIIILYDHKGNVDAARFAWILQYYGFDQFRILIVFVLPKQLALTPQKVLHIQLSQRIALY